MSHLKHNPLTVTFRNNPSLCKFSICTDAFCLLNVINWRCICSFFFFCQHDSTNPRPYFKLLHRTSLLTPRTPQGGGSPSVLLTLYKAGGACFPHLDFFLMFFMFDFNSKKSLKQMNFLQREHFLLSFIQALLSRVTLLCLFQNNKTKSKDIICFEWELLFAVWKHRNLFQIYWHE